VTQGFHSGERACPGLTLRRWALNMAM
jgi:hypothetical protein